jgi:Lipocalin-like domain
MNRGMKMLNSVCLIAALVLPHSASAADKSVVGTWKLLSWVSEDAESGKIINVFGEKPNGYLIYTPGGRMAVNLSADGRKALSGDRVNTPAEERALAFSSNIAYSGTYDITPEGIMHHVEVATFQNWVGTEQFRYVVVDGDTINMKTPPIKGAPPDGKTKVMTLVFKRVE